MKALLISPTFFDYASQIQHAIERKGMECFLVDEKPSNNAVAKIIIRVAGQKKCIQHFLFKNLKRKINSLNVSAFEYIIIIKGECISTEFMLWIKEKYKESKIIFYAWDSIKNYPHVKQFLPLFDQCFTFDNKDALNFSELQHLPLFYSPHYKKSDLIPKADRISFIGSYHSDRFHVLKRISEKYGRDYDLQFTLYFPSVVILMLCLLKNLKYLSKYKDIKFTLKSIPTEKIVSEYNISQAVIDIHHPNQNGLTMRAIELLPLRRKIITTNVSVQSYLFYNVNNICVIDRDDPVIDNVFINSSFSYLQDDFTISYSIDSWASKLLSI